MTWPSWCVKPWDHGRGWRGRRRQCRRVWPARDIGQETRPAVARAHVLRSRARDSPGAHARQPMPKEGNPRAVFEKLFGQGDTGQGTCGRSLTKRLGGSWTGVKGEALRGSGRRSSACATDLLRRVRRPGCSVREIERRVQMATQRDT